MKSLSEKVILEEVDHPNFEDLPLGTELKGSLFSPVAMTLTDGDIKKNITNLEEAENRYLDTYFKFKTRENSQSISNTNQFKKPQHHSNPNPSTIRRPPVNPSRAKPDKSDKFPKPPEHVTFQDYESAYHLAKEERDYMHDHDSSNEISEDSSEEAPENAKKNSSTDPRKQWAENCMLDDLEILYDPLSDYKDLKHVAALAQTSDTVAQQPLADFETAEDYALSCAFCHMPVSYNVLGEKHTKDGKRFFICKQSIGVDVDLNSTEERRIGDLWEVMKLEDETYENLVELVFKTKCGNCDTELGEYYSGVDRWVLETVIEGTACITNEI